MPSEVQPSLLGKPRDHKQARGSVINLLRGTFACPTIAALAELGLVERMLAGPFSVENFPDVADRRGLSSVFRYLHSLNLLEAQPEGKYGVTVEGRTALKRSGAFLLLFSYRGYFENLSGILSGKADATVNRRHNVLGSGALHSNKFFPAVWQMLKETPPAAIIDVGCGDGQFLANACSEWPDIAVAAVDLSPISVETTLKRLAECGRSDVVGVVQSGANVADWIADLPAAITTKTPLALSMWFVVHEFSEGDPEVVINFFRELRSALPTAEIILGEITALPPELLAEHHATSIMPEFLLFHELSKQGVLSWETWHDILRDIPYSLAGEQLFDLVGTTADESSPSSFVWHLKPDRLGN
jgi:2-ketoarginine methyltransferase